MNPFIALEGCDGAGKTTLRKLLCASLESVGLEAVTVGQHAWLDPRDARALVAVRERRSAVPPELLSAAYLRDKQLHGSRNVRPALAHAIVIADRWLYSDAVYHAALYEIPVEHTLDLHRKAGTLVPDLLIYVATAPDLAYARILNRGRQTRHYERPSDLNRIAAEYEAMLAGPSERLPSVIRVSNTAGIDVLRSQVEDVVVPAARAIASRSGHGH